MLKYLLVALIASLIYRFWSPTPKIDKTGNEEKEDFTDYEEVE